MTAPALAAICHYDLLGYPDPLCVRPGEQVRIHVSSEKGATRYHAELVRLICGDDTPGGPGVQETRVPGVADHRIQGRRQALHIGSFGMVIPPAATFDATADFTVACRILPTTPAHGVPQTIMARHDAVTGRGWRLGLDADGVPVAELGGITLRGARPLLAGCWYALVLTHDASDATARLVVQALRPFPAGPTGGAWTADIGPVDATGLPLTFAAQGSDPEALRRGIAGTHFNGKIEAPCIFARALDPAGIAALVARGLPDPMAQGLVAAWDLAQDIPGSRIVDVGLHGCHGTLVNLPTRGVTGSLFDASAMAWPDRPAHFAAVHFHDDDFEDARWDADFSIDLPHDLASGVYAARLTPEDGGMVERVVFFVAAPRGKAAAPVAFLASTATYMAYANSHYAVDMAEMEPKRGLWMTIGAPEIFLNERRDLGLSPYDTHSDGSGVCYSSRLRPLFALRIMQRLWAFNADTHITEWLAAEGIPCDLITDEHLHAEGPAVLAPYRAVITGTHPEYWTTRMLDSLEAWQNEGGRLMYLGGNGFYWRTAFHPDKPWLIEVRRAESGARYWETAPGEAYHSFTGEYGGLWRRLGRSPHRYVGVGTVATGFDHSTHYRRTAAAADPRAAWIFEGVAGERIGDFGLVGGGAAGSEIDSADAGLGTPPHALIVARSEDHSRYTLLAPETMTSSIAAHNGEEHPEVHADMVFYEGPNGGAVFSVGSIAWAASLPHAGHTNDVARITGNVLRRFIDPTPFPTPPWP
jgi:N,N-dimethylformamidase